MGNRGCKSATLPPFLMRPFSCFTGLKISLNVEQEEYLSQLSQAAGVKVVVHPQGQMPFPNEEGFFASPGHSTAIGLSKVGEALSLRNINILKL